MTAKENKLNWDVDCSGYRCVTAKSFDSNPALDIKSAEYFCIIVGLDITPANLQQQYIMSESLCLAYESKPKYYDPMRRPHLFRTFAGLSETPSAVIDFANKYGLLHHHEYEPLEDWYVAIRQFRKTLQLYESADKSEILHLLPWLEGPDDEYYRLPTAKQTLEDVARLQQELKNKMPADRYSPETHCWDPSPGAGEIWRARFKGNIMSAAGWAVREIITLELRKQASICLFAEDYFAPEATGIGFVPYTLLGAMWLQFAQELCDMKKAVHCKQCGKVFWLVRKARKSKSGEKRLQRQDTKYCSERCRKAAYRERLKAKAILVEG